MGETETDLKAIARWLEQRGYPPCAPLRLSGDVSHRRYYRLDHPTGSHILAVYPADMLETLNRFLLVDGLLRDVGVDAPRILDSDSRQGYVLQEDLGPETLFDLRAAGWERLRPFFRTAQAHRSNILRLVPDEVARLNPPLDGEALERELDQTFRLLLEPAGLLSDPRLDRRLRQHLSGLCRELGHAELVPCHRDFMARNLIPLGDRLVVIDHQDLRLGPFNYDLASLLNDSLFPPAEEERQLLEACELGPGGLRSYRLAAVQRTLKAAGTFAAFARRGHDRHLPLVVPTLQRALLQLARTEDGLPLAESLKERWGPALAAGPTLLA